MKIEQPMEPRISELTIPEIIPVIPGNDVIYPSMIVPMAITEENIIRLVDEAATTNKIVGLFAQRPDSTSSPPGNLYRVGTAAVILRMLKMPDGSVRVFIQGICRIGIIDFVQTEPYLRARVGRIVEKVEKTPELEALRQNVLSAFQKIVASAPNLPNELAIAAMNMPEPGSLADFVAAHINLNPQERQEILEAEDVRVRLEKLMALVNRELEILELRSRIQSQAQSVMDKAQREFFLREQLKAIQRELGETDEHTMEINELKKKVEEANLPPEAKKEAEQELDRLAKMPPHAAEYTT
ncbi:MAG: LON peptidase substrate-binding domain-containing protein, partial [Dehalococcoidales bacterium]|nr:LON peptidase substrate-binding domain-containing protein [Dehalococcoidales bacterium]